MVQRRHAGHVQSRDDQRDPVPDRAAAETGRQTRRFRDRALHAGARAGAFAGADVDADRTQSGGGAWAISRRISAASWRSRRTRSASPAQIFPTFLALNSSGAVGPGYLPAKYAPFKVTPAAAGIAQHHQSRRPDALQQPLEAAALARRQPADRLAQRRRRWRTTTTSTSARKQLMYNPVVNSAFGFTAAESARYGSTALGQRLPGGVAGAEGQSGHAVHPDHVATTAGTCTQNIYAAGDAAGAGPRPWTTASPRCSSDLKANGLLSKHAGRDVRRVRPHGGPAHRAGGPRPLAAAVRVLRRRRRQRRPGDRRDQRHGVRHGRISAGRRTATSTPEDIEATIYSALGIDWTTVRRDDPLGRGFEYVPKTGPFQFYPVHELWSYAFGGATW